MDIQTGQHDIIIRHVQLANTEKANYIRWKGYSYTSKCSIVWNTFMGAKKNGKSQAHQIFEDLGFNVDVNMGDIKSVGDLKEEFLASDRIIGRKFKAQIGHNRKYLSVKLLEPIEGKEHELNEINDPRISADYLYASKGWPVLPLHSVNVV